MAHLNITMTDGSGSVRIEGTADFVEAVQRTVIPVIFDRAIDSAVASGVTREEALRQMDEAVAKAKIVPVNDAATAEQV